MSNMRRQYDQICVLPRSSSCNSTTNIIPSHCPISTTSFRSSVGCASPQEFPTQSIVRHVAAGGGVLRRLTKTRITFSTFVRSILSVFNFPSAPPACRWLSLPTVAQLSSIGGGRSLGRKVTGTLFGHRRGHVIFAVQEDPGSEPVFVVELAVSTADLVKEMSSGLVRIALECEKSRRRGTAAGGRLFGETTWTMYCNGRRCGQAASRACGEGEWRVLSTVRSVSVGAGVIPAAAEGELLYMRARFERVVGNRDSEAFYMLNPDGNGGPELSIFLLRI